jgi:hypothetical protein
MDRRDFIKKLCGITGGLALPAVAQAKTSEVRQVVTGRKGRGYLLQEAFPLFELVLMNAGASTEFPLDFMAPGSEPIISAYKTKFRQINKSIGSDYICLPTYDISAEGDSPAEVHLNLMDKLETEARELLCGAGNITSRHSFINEYKDVKSFKNNVQSYAEANNLFDDKITYIIDDRMYIAVIHRVGNLVAPVREPPEVFRDAEGKYYTYTNMGFAVLDNKYIIVGRRLHKELEAIC